ncbi:MAG: aldehyde dehydrogenase [Bacteroidota bacterium]
MYKILNYIDGELREPETGGWIDNYEPATGKVYSLIPDSDERDVAHAVAAARRAFPQWSTRSVAGRSDFMIRIADRIRERHEELAQAESTDNGKPLSLARKVDIPRGAANFRYFGQAVTQFHSETYDMGTNGFNYTLRRPIGVAGCISPWNLPLYLFTWKIAPALAAGNTVVAKPSEITPMTAHLLSEICIEVGLPPGVLNIVHGYGAKTGAAIVAHPDVPAISFTGGTTTGKAISAVAAPMFKKLSLELGGKNPNLVFEDCEYESALATSVRSSFANQGQICLCGSRIYVQRGIYERFVADFIQRVEALKIGDPQEADTDLGAIVSQDHYKKNLAYIQLAREEGGEILCGGKAAPVPNERCTGGWFLEPTVIAGLDIGCRTNQEEIFGPVVTIQPFSTEEEAIALANGTSYGLAATVHTRRLKRAHRVAAELEAGIVWINSWLVRDLRTPFGGVKASGVGREGGTEALHFFTEAKNVFIQL